MLSKLKIYRYKEGSAENDDVSDIYVNDVYLILFSIFLILLEMTFLNNFRIFNVAPDLLLINVIVVSMFFDKKTIIKFAFYAGMLFDIMIGKGVGIHIIFYFFVVFVILRFERIIFKDNYTTALVFIFFATFFYNFYIVGINFLRLLRPSLLYDFIYHVSIQIVYNLIIGLFIYRLVYFSIYKKKEKEV